MSHATEGLTNLTNRRYGVQTDFMGKPVNLYEAKSHLSELVQRASDGEEIVIAKAGKPMARLMPLAKAKNRISEMFGKNVMGITYIAPDFDDDLPLELFLGDGTVDPE